MDPKRDVIHPWQMVELTFRTENRYENPYTEVTLWVELEGPEFSKRVYGFWDGGSLFRLRIAPTAAGLWKWTSGSNQQDAGLNGKTGTFTAVEWTEAEKQDNPNRRGFIVASEDGHTLKYADGTPFLLVGDTWWGTPTFRYQWEGETPLPDGGESFQQMVQYRKAQGYNCIAMIAAFPTWANDGLPARLAMPDGMLVRAAWGQPGTGSARDMHNEGGRPFHFPGKVAGYETVIPDFDRINPDYFRYMDRKIGYLNDNGFVPFIEAVRRDISFVWKKYGGWPDSYTRYVQYLFSRYQAHSCILSPIHFDTNNDTIPGKEYNEPINLAIDRFGPPPFGTLLSANASPSTLVNFGGPEEAKWLTFHQIGNWREHDHHWYLTDIFHADPPRPALHGEPYYPGWPRDNPPTDSEEADINTRSGLYGSFLSGGLAGYIYGVEGMWQGNIEDGLKYRMYDTLKIASGKQVGYLKTFATINGNRYTELIPDHDLVTPSRAGDPIGYRGWAYCAATPKRDFYLIYCENDCPQITVRGAIPLGIYSIATYNPRTGAWRGDNRYEEVVADTRGRLCFEPFATQGDWGVALILRYGEE